MECYDCKRGTVMSLSEDVTSEGPSARLLVCDDSHIERLALANFLRGTGYDVHEARDGADAISHIKQKPVDLVLLDLQMVGHDGFEALSYIQEHHAALPVILLSGMPVDQIQHKMNRLHKPELPPLLLKPVDPDQLLQVVALQLSGELPTG